MVKLEIDWKALLAERGLDIKALTERLGDDITYRQVYYMVAQFGQSHGINVNVAGRILHALDVHLHAPFAYGDAHRLTVDWAGLLNQHNVTAWAVAERIGVDYQRVQYMFYRDVTHLDKQIAGRALLAFGITLYPPFKYIYQEENTGEPDERSKDRTKANPPRGPAD